MPAAHCATQVYNTLGPTAFNSKLTRACKACIKAKRKCSIELPACTRCQTKGTICEYENQPLTEHGKQRHNGEDDMQSLRNIPRTRDISFEPLHMNPSLTWIRLGDPTVAHTVDERTLSYLNNQLKMHIISFNQTGATTFIHSKLPHSTLLAGLRYLIAIIASDQTFIYTGYLKAIQADHLSVLSQTLAALVSTIPKLYSYEELLSFTQSLILFQILTLFIIPYKLLPASIQQTTAARHQLLKSVTFKLWDSAPTYLPAYLSTHEAYALAESIRRTVIVSHELQAQCSVYSRGFYEPGLFGWSLPFDRRFQLWDAANVLEFDETVDTIGQGHGPQHLVTYREFCELFDQLDVESVDGPFATMILVGAMGLDVVEQRYGARLSG
jgi:hypothetical protein